MAIGFTSIGTGSSKTPASPFVITLSAGASIGDLVVVCIANITASNTVSTVVDSRSNAYSIASPSSGVNGDAELWFSVLTVALLANDTVSVTMTTTATATAVSVIQVTGLPSAQIDKIDSNVGSSTTPTVGTTYTTTNAVEAVICVAAVKGPSSDATPTAGTGFTIIGRVGTSAGGATTNETCDPEDRSLSSVTTFTAGNTLMTLGTSRAWQQATATWFSNPIQTVVTYAYSSN